MARLRYVKRGSRCLGTNNNPGVDQKKAGEEKIKEEKKTRTELEAGNAQRHTRYTEHIVVCSMEWI